MNDNSYKVIEVDINEILPNRFQPRIQFDEEEILELSDSIKEHGVIQPIVVRTIGDKYEIIAGERRYKASVLAGKETVPVIIKNLNDKDSAEIALIENIQRKNLTPIEEALSYKKILDMGYITQEQLAVKLGKSQSSVANKIRLLNLSDEVQEALLDNQISERHARSLLRVKSISDQNKLLDRIIKERLTVRRTDEEIDKLLKGINEIEEKIKKIEEEKEGINMNNEINQIPNIVTSQNNTFDIFGGTPAPVTPVVPTVPEVPVQPEVPTMGGFQFDANGNVIGNTPVAPVAPVVPTVPEVPVQPEVPTMGGFQFDANGNVVGNTPAAPVAPVMPVVPEVPVQPEVPTMGGFQFDSTGNVIGSTPAAPVEPVMPAVPEVPVVSEISIPQMSPIIDSSSLTSVIEQEPTVVDEPVVAPPTMPEINSTQPIIITDYSKQYDPVMPEVNITPQTKVDFKEIVSAIRECSEKIEKYGYKIDVEEYDLSTLYQVVFKIEK